MQHKKSKVQEKLGDATGISSFPREIHSLVLCYVLEDSSNDANVMRVCKEWGAIAQEHIKEQAMRLDDASKRLWTLKIVVSSVIRFGEVSIGVGLPSPREIVVIDCSNGLFTFNRVWAWWRAYPAGSAIPWLRNIVNVKRGTQEYDPVGVTASELLEIFDEHYIENSKQASITEVALSGYLREIFDVERKSGEIFGHIFPVPIIEQWDIRFYRKVRKFCGTVTR